MVYNYTLMCDAVTEAHPESTMGGAKSVIFSVCGGGGVGAAAVGRPPLSAPLQ